MKRSLIIIVIIMICFAPAAALANSPGPLPYDNYVLIDNYSQVASVQIMGYDNGNNYCEMAWSEPYRELKLPYQKAIYFDNYIGEPGQQLISPWQGKLKSFQLVVYFKDGGKATSNLIDIVEYGIYIYSVKDNTLKEGTIEWMPDGLNFFFSAAMLILPLLFTVLVEWIVSLAFRLKPGKYVVIINFISNPLMNVLLMLIFANIVIDFYLTLIILEALVAGAEFWYYTRKYREYTKKRLLLFTITANLASWFLYWYLSPLLR